jgi:hypothetical protein
MDKPVLPRVSVRGAMIMLGLVTLLSAFTVYIDQQTSTVLLMVSAFTLAFSIALYALLQGRKGAFYLPLLGFVLSAIMYFTGMFL